MSRFLPCRLPGTTRIPSPGSPICISLLHLISSCTTSGVSLPPDTSLAPPLRKASLTCPVFFPAGSLGQYVFPALGPLPGDPAPQPAQPLPGEHNHRGHHSCWRVLFPPL